MLPFFILREWKYLDDKIAWLISTAEVSPRNDCRAEFVLVENGEANGFCSCELRKALLPRGVPGVPATDISWSEGVSI